ncbi:dehydrogenase [Streptomyces armeniacus]|uniref:Dehydrogenase n=1 Tax=Streptomyces armeniacus TaxID=83291 RepID=A0A345XQM7_9ACTN|nr:M14 family zinc carboxypeptidase [Streptomyces armeniacus]AXK33943.1 dehydrogenase [Streptomyces armeniacus]
MDGTGETFGNVFGTVEELGSRARELALRRPDRCAVRQVGTSRLGAPLVLLTVGHGPRDVLVVAGAHANEPVGGVTALELARRLSAGPQPPERAGARWHFLLCLDPDGARRNEGWLRGPYNDLARYHRHSFRPHFAGQPEWLPAPGTPALPETRALLDLLDELRPVLQCSLHGVDIGGSWVQLTREVPGLAGPLAASAAARGIPLELGPFDAFYWPSRERGVFLMPGPDGRERHGVLPDDNAHSHSTWFHPHGHGTVTAVIEVPMWADDRVADEGTAYERTLHGISARLRDQSAELAALLASVRPVLPARSPLLEPLDEYLTHADGIADLWDPDVARDSRGRDLPPLPPLNTARLASLDIAGQRVTLRAAGLLCQLLDGGDGPGPARDTVRRLVADWCGPYAARVRPVPVAAQVAHQADTVLAVFDRLAPHAVPPPQARSAIEDA